MYFKQKKSSKILFFKKYQLMHIISYHIKKDTLNNFLLNLIVSQMSLIILPSFCSEPVKNNYPDEKTELIIEEN